jgi:hypothetical protein
MNTRHYYSFVQYEVRFCSVLVTIFFLNACVLSHKTPIQREVEDVRASLPKKSSKLLSTRSEDRFWVNPACVDYLDFSACAAMANFQLCIGMNVVSAFGIPMPCEATCGHCKFAKYPPNLNPMTSLVLNRYFRLRQFQLSRLLVGCSEHRGMRCFPYPVQSIMPHVLGSRHWIIHHFKRKHPNREYL